MSKLPTSRSPQSSSEQSWGGDASTAVPRLLDVPARTRLRRPGDEMRSPRGSIRQRGRESWELSARGAPTAFGGVVRGRVGLRPRRRRAVQRRSIALLRPAGGTRWARAGPAPRPAARLRDAAARAGVHPKIVSEALGHASVGITLDVYSHVLPSMSKAAADADAIEAVFGE